MWRQLTFFFYLGRNPLPIFHGAYIYYSLDPTVRKPNKYKTIVKNRRGAAAGLLLFKGLISPYCPSIDCVPLIFSDMYTQYRSVFLFLKRDDGLINFLKNKSIDMGEVECGSGATAVLAQRNILFFPPLTSDTRSPSLFSLIISKLLFTQRVLINYLLNWNLGNELRKWKFLSNCGEFGSI